MLLHPQYAMSILSIDMASVFTACCTPSMPSSKLPMHVGWGQPGRKRKQRVSKLCLATPQHGTAHATASHVCCHMPAQQHCAKGVASCIRMRAGCWTTHRALSLNAVLTAYGTVLHHRPATHRDACLDDGECGHVSGIGQGLQGYLVHQAVKAPDCINQLCIGSRLCSGQGICSWLATHPCNLLVLELDDLVHRQQPVMHV